MPAAVQPKMESPTVIVVGAGYAGLSTAIECTLRGMKVKMYESAEDLKPVGSWPLVHANDGCLYFLGRLRHRY